MTTFTAPSGAGPSAGCRLPRRLPLGNSRPWKGNGSGGLRRRLSRAPAQAVDWQDRFL